MLIQCSWGFLQNITTTNDGNRLGFHSHGRWHRPVQGYGFRGDTEPVVHVNYCSCSTVPPQQVSPVFVFDDSVSSSNNGCAHQPHTYQEPARPRTPQSSHSTSSHLPVPCETGVLQGPCPRELVLSRKVVGTLTAPGSSRRRLGLPRESQCSKDVWTIF